MSSSEMILPGRAASGFVARLPVANAQITVDRAPLQSLVSCPQPVNKQISTTVITKKVEGILYRYGAAIRTMASAQAKVAEISTQCTVCDCRWSKPEPIRVSRNYEGEMENR